MESITSTAMQDIVDDAAERELWIVGRLFERPPYFHAGKGGDTRLARALRLCTDNKITPNSDGSYQVEGSAGRSYRVGDSCSCPNSQKGSSRWCYHAVGVALYVEWQKRLPAAPIALGTLRAGTLPLPPVTVDERLAQVGPHHADVLADAYAATVESQEDRMPDDEYLPEPDEQEAPVAILEPSAPVPVLRPLAPADDDLEQALQAWTLQRGIVRKFLAQELKANVDYYTLKIGGKDSKPSLSESRRRKGAWLVTLVGLVCPGCRHLGDARASNRCRLVRVHAAHQEWGDRRRRPRRQVAQKRRWRCQQGDQDGGEVGHGLVGAQDRGD